MYPLKVVGECDPSLHGTEVTFYPDGEIFEETEFDYDTLKIRLRETAFLTKNLKIILRDDREAVSYTNLPIFEDKYFTLKKSTD